MMRMAAIERLRVEFGIKITKHTNCSSRIADEIRKVEPGLSQGDPMALIRAWVAIKPSDVVPGRLAYGSGQPYTLGDQLRHAKARLKGMPSPVNMSSKVLYSPEFA